MICDAWCQAMGLDFSLHGRFYLEYEPEGSQGFYSIREGCRRVGLSGGERKPEANESGEGGGGEAEAAGLASPSVLKSGEGEAVTMLEGEGEWRYHPSAVCSVFGVMTYLVVCVKCPDLTRFLSELGR